MIEGGLRPLSSIFGFDWRPPGRKPLTKSLGPAELSPITVFRFIRGTAMNNIQRTRLAEFSRLYLRPRHAVVPNSHDAPINPIRSKQPHEDSSATHVVLGTREPTE